MKRKEKTRNSTQERYVKKVFMLSAEYNIEATAIDNPISKKIVIQWIGFIILLVVIFVFTNHFFIKHTIIIIKLF